MNQCAYASMSMTDRAVHPSGDRPPTSIGAYRAIAAIRLWTEVEWQFRNWRSMRQTVPAFNADDELRLLAQEVKIASIFGLQSAFRIKPTIAPLWHRCGRWHGGSPGGKFRLVNQ